MGASTLSKLQMEQYKEIVKAYGDERFITMDDTDYVRLKETLAILTMLEYIQPIEHDGGYTFFKRGNFKDFDAWHKDRVREERKLSRREWKIGICGGLIGLIPFIVTTVIPWLISLFTANG